MRHQGLLPDSILNFLDHFDITSPMRYPASILSDMYAQFCNPEKTSNKPRCLFISTKTDWNGALHSNKELLLSLGQTHEVIVTESASASDIREKIMVFGSDSPVQLIILDGHGGPTGMSLSYDGNTHRSKSLDWRTVKRLKDLGGALSPEVEIILNSCSVGREHPGRTNIATRIFHALNPKRLHAPVDNCSKLEVIMDAGTVKSAVFNVRSLTLERIAANS